MSRRPLPVVLDASVTAAWLLPDEASDDGWRVYTRLRQGDLEIRAPALWLAECANLIASSVRRSRLSTADAMTVWSVLDAIRVRVELTEPTTAQWRDVLTLAIEQSISIYDATYLWLSLTLRVPLLTHDRRLALAATAAGAVEPIGLQDLA